jgi:Cu+-exporting ATPase
MEIDPVCGMEVDPTTAAWTYEYEGTTYRFCAKACMEDFAEDPGAYLG